MKTKNIMIVGVGGQGSLLASKLLGHLLMEQGYDVKVSEVHGMSQRGGSVVTYVRYGDRVNSPVIDKGEADYIVSFELLEAARWLSYLKPDGQIVTSTQQIDPMPGYHRRGPVPGKPGGEDESGRRQGGRPGLLGSGRGGRLLQGGEHRADGPALPLLRSARRGVAEVPGGLCAFQVPGAEQEGIPAG